jgi:hypothetical protein
LLDKVTGEEGSDFPMQGKAGEFGRGVSGDPVTQAMMAAPISLASLRAPPP